MRQIFLPFRSLRNSFFVPGPSDAAAAGGMGGGGINDDDDDDDDEVRWMDGVWCSIRCVQPTAVAQCFKKI